MIFYNTYKFFLYQVGQLRIFEAETNARGPNDYPAYPRGLYDLNVHS